METTKRPAMRNKDQVITLSDYTWLERSKARFTSGGQNQLGLKKDDLLYEGENAREALKRLPRSTLEERHLRVCRAVNLLLKKQVLAPEQWTRYSEDPYLQPYLEEVQREKSAKRKPNLFCVEK
ncbi:cytochrome b-c1 complex subunit 7-like [Branchiostoma floridae]|uniref:Cytochrome b-c1 complex subunit 7 n=2 Tax=Branchiostoma floridae TaxID=7739 RepID=A0A9J7N884_BRAFL|nr:cytochrome b-c1 complex subunit 7-like [Branchiostoma floridae]